MELSKILTHLYSYFQDSPKSKMNKKSKKNIEKLLEKLRKKEKKMIAKLASTNDDGVQKTLKRSLKVIRAQQKKGKKIIASN